MCISSVDGNYTQWSNWTSCSATCGEGTQTRTRYCTNPPPLHGGRDCTEIGSNIEIQPCKNQDCLGKNCSDPILALTFCPGQTKQVCLKLSKQLQTEVIISTATSTLCTVPLCCLFTKLLKKFAKKS